MDSLFIQLIISSVLILLGSLLLIWVNKKIYGASKDRNRKGRGPDV